ncbi:TetR family transcriptional regulator [Streptomyces albireticuli]|uniref:TetR family transcriptional regulator n=1 Tax=Streptomyces albireticuli TaxID=1940 RepID=A0A1Z2KV81_9ACTN|nr:TetR/AcrR family transcriptional regulator [Streptomyces albireticuli]ARZ65967.1 TetR family transcriptional regulator [Streptomyces albireticuli]
MESGSPLRERLIDIGVDLVMTEGTASLGLREIARRAGVSHGAPRRYFPTHHALLSAIAHRGFADLKGRFEAATGGTTSPRGQLRALGRAYVGYALEHRGMFELMFRHDLLDSEDAAPDRPRLRESTLPLFGVVVELVTRCRAERDPAHGPGAAEDAGAAAVTAAALWSNLHGIAQLWAWGSLRLALGTPSTSGAPDDDRLDRLVTAALDAHLGPVTP